MIILYACLCGYREEIPEGEPAPVCMNCGTRMYAWRCR